MSETTLRRATAEDASRLTEIGRRTFVETFGHLYPAADLEAFLGDAHSLERACADLVDPLRAVWLAERDGNVVGYALAGPSDLPNPDVTARCGELKRLYLLREAQNGGLGGQLCATAISWLLRDGPRNLWIGVWSQNLGAQRFYARQGFEKVGEYGFPVGRTVDREFILRRNVESFSATGSRRPEDSPE